MANFQPWKQSQLNRLARQGKRARDHRLARDNGRRCREYNNRQQGPRRIEQEERIFDRLGFGEHKRALTQIIDSQRGKYHHHPGEADRLPAKMAEIGIQGFGASDGEKHSAERDQSRLAVRQHEPHARQGIERGHDLRIIRDMNETAPRHDAEPDERDRAKPISNRAGAEALNREQTENNDDGDRDDERIHRIGDQLQPFDG